MKNKLITILGSLIAILFIGILVSAETVGPGATWFYTRGLLKPITTVSQVLIGGTTTSTSADLEIQGSIGLNGDAITSWSEAGTNFWSDSGTTLSPVTSTRTLTLPSLNPGECVQVGAGGVITTAGFSCATSSTAPEADPIWTAVSTTYLTKTEASSTYLKISDWLLKTTDDLVEGITNLYFTLARARDAISETITGITYTSSTGVFTLDVDYEIPLIASTTNWETAYSWGNHASAGYLTTETDPIWSSVSTSYLTILDASNTYQLIGDYLTTSTGLTVSNFATDTISQWYNDAGYITTTPDETDPIWTATSSNYLTTAVAAITYYTNAAWDLIKTTIVYVTTAFGGDVSGTYDNLQVTDNSHNHNSTTVSDLVASNFASQNISQWTNDAGYVTTSGSGVTTFIATTTDTFDGVVTTSTLTGYVAANNVCASEYADSHLCSDGEIMNYIANGGDITGWGADNSTAWYAEVAPGYLANANDCGGFTNNSNTYLGAFYLFNATTGGRGALVNCSNEKSLACCK